MKLSTLHLLACPACHAQLSLKADRANGGVDRGSVYCSRCQKDYPIADGIPRFIRPEQLTGQDRRFARLYDFASFVYLPVSQMAQAIGRLWGISRREVVDRLEPRGGRILEVSMGPGVNLPYLIGAPGVDEVFGLDISLGQLQHCRSYCRKRGWSVDLFLGMAEHLPFRDESFEGVLHIGGINFFSDKAQAIREMIRVARPGAKIVIADETEKLARVYDWSIPGFSRAFGGKREAVTAPVDLVPPDMDDVRLGMVWRGACYCLEFRKPRRDSYR